MSDYVIFTLLQFDEAQAGLSGLSFDEGTFGVFGYVTGGSAAPGEIDQLLKQLQPGDVIEKVKVVSGLDRLIDPDAAA